MKGMQDPGLRSLGQIRFKMYGNKAEHRLVFLKVKSICLSPWDADRIAR
jgi:hypothetical protein